MSTTVSLHLLRVGACRHLERMADRGGRFKSVDFPALCGLIRHPTQGWMLYDTGYAEHFFSATQTWPERLYRALPVHLAPSELLSHQLAQHGIGVADVGTVIVSHYHADHIAGLRDFPNARFLALAADTSALMALQGHRWRATFKGQLHGLLPTDFLSRLCEVDRLPLFTLPNWMSPFRQGFDLLGDQSLIGVPLPGHSHGQLGLWLPDADGRSAFLVADACWSLPACRAGRLPSRLTTFVGANGKRYQDTFFGLQTLALREPALSLLPSHCQHAWQAFRHAEH
jgi:glyoxylase-like metal-dependent hydrolase (beta-lactamase superfamily II)